MAYHQKVLEDVANKGATGPCTVEGCPCKPGNKECNGWANHNWRKCCANCRHDKTQHNIEHVDIDAFNPGKLNIADKERQKRFFNRLHKRYRPAAKERGDKVDKDFLGTLDGLSYQRPQQDLKPPAADTEATEAQRNEYIKRREAWEKDQKKDATVADAPIKGCKDGLTGEAIPGGEITIKAMKPDGAPEYFLPNNFACACCKKEGKDAFINELKYYYGKDADGKPEMVCQRHYYEQTYKRCAGCEELIISGCYVDAMGKRWHKEHFCCHDCDVALFHDAKGSVKKDYFEDEGIPYCTEHFSSRVPRCYFCKNGIMDKNFITLDDSEGTKFTFHLDCFRCGLCGVKFGSSYFQSGYLARGEDAVCYRCNFERQAVPMHNNPKDEYVAMEHVINFLNRWRFNPQVLSIKTSGIFRLRRSSKKDQPVITIKHDPEGVGKESYQPCEIDSRLETHDDFGDYVNFTEFEKIVVHKDDNRVTLSFKKCTTTPCFFKLDGDEADDDRLEKQHWRGDGPFNLWVIKTEHREKLIKDLVMAASVAFPPVKLNVEFEAGASKFNI